MLTILYYCLKVIFCSGVLLGYYGLALRNNRFHQWNRYYLLLATVLPFVLPLLKIPIPFFATAEETPLLVRGVEIAGLSDFYMAQLNRQQQFHVSWQLAVAILYLAVALFLTIIFIKNIFKINQLKQRYPCEFINGIQFYNTQEQGTPFSFFKNIFWNKRIELHSKKGQQMLAHELAHITEKHSTDKVFIEVMVALAWWNPVLYFIRKELAVIHEFIADKKASAGDENLQYASLLLMKAMGSEQFAMANPFFHSQLKRRLTMLTTSNNPKFSYVRRLMVLPLAAFAIVLFSFKYKEFKQQGLLRAPEPLTVIIDAGHGGADNGALGTNGEKEDDIALQIALRIKTLSEGTNIKVILSRNTDTLSGNTTNKEASGKYRVSLSKYNNADFFISLHMNSDATGNGRGISSFVSNNNTVLNQKSRVIASAILDEISGMGLPVATSLQCRKDEGIFVLEQNTAPALLLELGYITNKADLAFIQQPQNQDLIAKNILNALARHGKKAIETTAKSNDNTELADVAVQGFYEDSVKGKALGKANRLILSSDENPKYKNVAIETITPTDDFKGIVVKTIDKKIYFLDKAEAEKVFDIKITTNGITSKVGSQIVIADKIIYKNPNKTITSPQGITINLDSSNLKVLDASNTPLYVLDGVIKIKSVLQTLNPDDIKSIDVLKGDKAIAEYGDKGKNGVIKITTKNPNNVKESIVQGYKSNNSIEFKMPQSDPNQLDEIVVKGHKTTPGANQPKQDEVVVTGYKTVLDANKQKPEEIVVTGFKTDKTFTKVEESAQFPGGADGWRRYLEKNLQYPILAEKNSTEGTVRVELTVNPDGTLKNIHALNNPGDGLAEEAEKMFIKGPKWVPAKQNGKLVTYRFVQAITFRLNKAPLEKPVY